MPKITFITPDESRVELEVPVGANLMRVATAEGIEGIVGDCGGGLTCATCHVFVEEAFVPLASPASTNEDQMLDFTAAPRQPNSRLSCQLMMTKALDGLTLRVADPQL